MKKRFNNEDQQQSIIVMQEPSSHIGGIQSVGLGLSMEEDPRSIWFTSEVYPETVIPVIQQIQSINYADEQKEKEYTLNGQHYIRYPIKLYISSYGGSVYDGLGLAGIIKSSKTPVHTYAVGKVMSMGFLLALSGHKRFAYPHTTYMCHSLSDWSVGKIADLQESVEEDIRLQTKIDNIILENSNITQEQLNDTHTRKFDWYLDATTALELNCVDEIIN